jgi:hypothetical protein
MSDVCIMVKVLKHDIVILGERNAVEYAVWTRLFENVKDAEGRETKIRTPTGALLRQWAIALGKELDLRDNIYSRLREQIMSDIKYECITIDREA